MTMDHELFFKPAAAPARGTRSQPEEPESDHPVYDGAMRYLAAGMSFYPAQPGSKFPHLDLLPHELRKVKGVMKPVGIWSPYRDRQPTPEEVWHWFMRKPTPNIVLITGKPSGRIVVDLDTPSAVKMFRRNYEGPPTPAVASRRGLHVHFAYEPVELQYNALEGAEVLTDGRSCTLPPSVHESGFVYKWVVPLETPLAPLPDWIKEACRPVPKVVPVAPAEQREIANASRYAMGAFQSEINKLAECRGNRNDACYHAGLKMGKYAAELGTENVVSALVSTGVGLGLSESEADSAIRSGMRNGGASDA